MNNKYMFPKEEEGPKLDNWYRFGYRGYTFELNSCHQNTTFTDRYICWEIHPNFDGGWEYTLIPKAWSWGAEDALRAGMEVDPFILELIYEWIGDDDE